MTWTCVPCEEVRPDRIEPPLQPAGRLRLSVYRLQGIVGMWG